LARVGQGRRPRHARAGAPLPQRRRAARAGGDERRGRRHPHQPLTDHERVNVRHVGASGLLVSEIGFGTTTLGEAVHGDEAVALVRHALARGITYFDTAVTYSGGRSEEILGEAL